MALPFYILDVFAETKYAGNQLAVVRDAAKLSTAEMQRIAKEMNYSETSFILSDTPREGGFDVRIFTPEEEVPFAGHPTLGTAYLIWREILQGTSPKVILNLSVGQISVQLEDGDLWRMTQRPPVFGRKYEPEAIARILNLNVAALDSRFPIQAVSTGLPFIIVPLKDLAAIKQAKVRLEELVELVKEDEAKAVLVFAPETYHTENQLNVRVFVDCYGIPEDPATGSANGCLAGYLVKYNYFEKSPIQVRVEQGYEIGRPSLVQLWAEQQAEDILVQVGGKVQLVAEGRLL